MTNEHTLTLGVRWLPYTSHAMNSFGDSVASSFCFPGSTMQTKADARQRNWVFLAYSSPIVYKRLCLLYIPTSYNEGNDGLLSSSYGSHIELNDLSDLLHSDELLAHLKSVS